MTKIVDLSPAVPHGFRGPPSTDLGVQLEVRTKNGTGYWQSTQLDLMSLHTGTHVESALHTVENGEAIDEVALDRVIGEAVVLDLTPMEPMQIIEVADLEKANEKLKAAGESIRPGDVLLLRTDWAQRHIGTQKYFKESPGLTEEAAKWIVCAELAIHADEASPGMRFTRPARRSLLAERRLHQSGREPFRPVPPHGGRPAPPRHGSSSAS
jgi:arylformamidase